MRAVQFDEFGKTDVLDVRDIGQPVPQRGEVLLEVKAAGVNLLDSVIRQGLVQDFYPVTFPAGLGTDIAGVVAAIGDGVNNVSVGDEVWGFNSKRNSFAQFAAVDASTLLPKPANVSWEIAGSLFIAGAAAYAAVDVIGVVHGDTVVVANAAGGVGSIAVQLAKAQGARVIGISGPSNADWLRSIGVEFVAYGDGVLETVRELAGGDVDAFVDAFGGDYVELALKLGVAPERINTLINFAAAAQHGVHAKGNNDAAERSVLSQLIGSVSAGALVVPIANTYPIDKVREAFGQLEQRHTHGKIVIIP